MQRTLKPNNMETLKNIDPKHLTEFQELLNRGLRSAYPHNPISILGWARNIHEQYMDPIIQADSQVELFNSEIPGVHLIATMLSEGNETMLATAEPDFVYIAIIFKDEYTTGIDPHAPGSLERLFTLVMCIMLSDCTGCCDALSILNINRAGIYAKGYVGQTYHS